MLSLSATPNLKILIKNVRVTKDPEINQGLFYVLYPVFHSFLLFTFLVLNGVSLTLKDTVDLTDDHSDGEKITGSLKREHTADGIKTVWTVTPSLRGDGHSLEGRLTCRKKHAQTVVWQAELTVSAAVGADPGEAAAADETLFAAQVLNYLTGYRNSLPEADRRQLDHMLRTDSWMNGAVIPVPSAK